MQTHHSTTPTTSTSPRYHLVTRKPFPPGTKADVWEFTDGLCVYCGVSLIPWRTFCIDHVLPLQRGGTNDIHNLVPCCKKCNSSKGTKTIGEWRLHLTNKDQGGFTPEQTEYLVRLGVELPQAPLHQFWFDDKFSTPYPYDYSDEQ